jgi:hypothetical protein
MIAAASLQVDVESEPGERGSERLRRIRLDGRKVEIVENVDQWHGPDYRYFKVKGDDGNLYVLRFDEGRATWEVTMFQSPQGEALATPVHVVKRRRTADS